MNFYLRGSFMKIIQNALISTGVSSKTKLVNILFSDKILNISDTPILSQKTEKIDIEGNLLIPGCIDSHVHFNDPGFTIHEDFLTGTTAAAYGGITTVIDMPCTSIPPVTNKENLYIKLQVIQPKALVDFAFWGGIRKNDFPFSKTAISELWNEGIIGFKLYTISGMETFGALNYKEIKEILKQLPDPLFAFHAEDEKIINDSIKSLSREKLKQFENFVKSRPVEAEVEAVKKILEIAQDSKIHFVHISSKSAAEIILNNKNLINVSFETCPHYLQFTSGDLSKLKGKLKTTPPVKFVEDKEFLRTTLKRGEIDFITTDHAGCDYKTEKQFDDFSRVYSGIPGTELFIPYIFSEFYIKEEVPLSTIIKITSENPAKRFGLYPKKGSLEIGTDADFTVLDIDLPFKVNEQELHSKGKYSPFNGEIFDCSIDKTIVRGEIVFDRKTGIKKEPGYGKWIRREF